MAAISLTEPEILLDVSLNLNAIVGVVVKVKPIKVYLIFMYIYTCHSFIGAIGAHTVEGDSMAKKELKVQS